MRTDSREYIVARKWDEKGYEVGYVQREAVTRCRDCKYRDGVNRCPLGAILDGDGFCSLGERSEP